MNKRVLSPREEKLKEELVKCGLEPVNAENVTIGNKDNVFMIKDSLLYKIKNTNSYVLFGEPINYTGILEKLKKSANNPEELKKLFGENMNLGNQEHTHEDGECHECCGKEEHQEREINGEEEPEETTVVEEEEVCNEDDIKLVMAEGKINRDDAISALKKANNDVIQALVDLNKK